tara:strand:+ start:62 stop:238 length:177 start_codon:yes stop_codon:yes gene_type:complete
MKELYSINEILGAVEELQKKANNKVYFEKERISITKKDDIPFNTLKLIEQAEEKINKR